MTKGCMEEGCLKPHLARSMCSTHYYRWRKTQGNPCTVDGCSAGQKAHGYCPGHYRQFRDGEQIRPLRGNRRAQCAISGCGRISEAQRFCRKHYYRWKVNGDALVTAIAAKGAGCRTKDGYRVLVFGGKQIREHRWIMEQHLGRTLLPDETVHHVNGVRDDNRLENLELWSASHPYGQRVEDKVEWAIMMLNRYAPERLTGDLT